MRVTRMTLPSGAGPAAPSTTSANPPLRLTHSVMSRTYCVLLDCHCGSSSLSVPITRVRAGVGGGPMTVLGVIVLKVQPARTRAAATTARECMRSLLVRGCETAESPDRIGESVRGAATVTHRLEVIARALAVHHAWGIDTS